MRLSATDRTVPKEVCNLCLKRGQELILRDYQQQTERSQRKCVICG